MLPSSWSSVLSSIQQQLAVPAVVVQQLNVSPPVEPTAWDTIEHSEWVPASVRAWAATANGLTVDWQSRIKLPTGLSVADGFVNLLPIEQIYRDWEGIIYFDFHDQSEDEWRKTFKIVDAIHPAAQACVGLYHTGEGSPQLFYYPFEGEPDPLGVDLPGYVALLGYSLGCENWQSLLIELFYSPQRPYVPADPSTQAIVTGMQAHIPSFDLTALVECFDRVRLAD